MKKRVLSLLFAISLVFGLVFSPSGPAAKAASGDLAVAGDPGFSAGSNGEVAYTASGTYTVTGVSGETIHVFPGITVNITLENVNIDVFKASNNCAFWIEPGATVNLTLVGTNTLISRNGCPGIYVPTSATLNISGGASDSLTATGDIGDGVNVGGAGIGGGSVGDINCGTVTISGGTVTATGAVNAACIGSGPRGNGGTVTISGGTVTAHNPNGKDIGASFGPGSNGSLYIGNASVKANVSFDVYQSPGSTTKVYNATALGLPASSTVNCSINGGNAFPCQTDAKGKLYLWLPIGTYDVLVNADSGSYEASGTVSATYGVFFALTKNSLPDGVLPDGVIGTPYNVTLTGAVPYTWIISTGTLPDGLSLSPSGTITGTPTKTGNYSFSAQIKSGDGFDLEYKTFSMTVYQTLLIDLSALSVSGGTLSPSFHKDNVAYAVTGSFGGSITVTATTAGAGATLTIGGNAATSGVAKTVTLNNGANLVPVTVTSPDGLSQKTYVLSVNGTVSNANLGSLSLSAGSLSFNPATTSYNVSVGNDVTSLNLTASASDSKAVMLLNGAVLPQGGTKSIPLAVGNNTVALIVIAQDATIKTYTITVTRQAVLTITNTTLPVGIVGSNYSVTLAATGGTGSYTWSAAGLPGSLTLDPATGIISGKLADSDTGTFTVAVTATDSNNVTGTQNITLIVHKGCGGGAYLIVSDGDAAYAGSYTSDGIPTLTVNSGVSGFTYFGVNITPVTGHAGTEVCVFVQTRNGQQVSINATKGDFDALNFASAAFNVKAGDVIKVYIVDSLTNTPGINPTIL